MSSTSWFLPQKQVIGPSSVTTINNVLIPAVSGDMSQATITSQTTNINRYQYIGYGLNWTGTPVGTFQINISGDGIIWYPLPGFTVSPAPNGSPGSDVIDMIGTSAPYIQIVYARTSGSGTLVASIWAKGT